MDGACAAVACNMEGAGAAVACHMNGAGAEQLLATWMVPVHQLRATCMGFKHPAWADGGAWRGVWAERAFRLSCTQSSSAL